METLPNTQQQIKITVTLDSQGASDILCGLNLFARLHPGNVATRCRQLADYLWIQAFHDIGRGKAA